MMHRLTLVAAGLLLLVACSGDDGGDAADTSVPETTTTTSAPLDPADVPAAPSAGCGATPEVPTGETQEALSSGGREWAYARHVPPAHDGTTPLPLVLDLHGLIEGGPIHALHTEMGAFGDEQGFVTLTPDSGREPAQWKLTGDRDVAFMVDLLDDVEADLCIDTNREYSTGLSMGGLMTTVLSCRLADRIAAAAPVAGIAIPEDCTPSRPVPAVIFHGTGDPILAYDGGLGAGAASLPLPGSSGETLGDMDEAESSAMNELLPGAEASAAAWAERNDCGSGVTEEAVADDVDLLTYDCPPDATVELYRVDGGGHTWPGSAFDQAIGDIVGTVTTSISANEVMWAFFQDHPLPA